LTGVQQISSVGAYSSLYRPISGVARATKVSADPAQGMRGNSSEKAATDARSEEIKQLRQRDRQVRAHEQAHKAVGGQYVIGGANFTYVTGPDGQRYAVGGEVRIDTSEIKDDPAATARKMQQVKRAALAPADPSNQDRRVAAEASQKEMEAMRKTLSQAQQQADSTAGPKSNALPAISDKAASAYRSVQTGAAAASYLDVSI